MSTPTVSISKPSDRAPGGYPTVSGQVSEQGQLARDSSAYVGNKLLCFGGGDGRTRGKERKGALARVRALRWLWRLRSRPRPPRCARAFMPALALMLVACA